MFSYDEIIDSLSSVVSSAYGENAFVCQHVSIDSRTIAPNSLFIAIQGPRYDGHDFIQEAVDRGASMIIVEHRPCTPLSCALVQVTNTYDALAELARAHRLKTSAKVIGVTGSSGKTTVKEMISHVGRLCGEEVLATHLNQNNRVGVALTLLSIKTHTSLAVIEAGINHPGEMELLSWMIVPDWVLVNNVHEAHLEGLDSLDVICREKLTLLKYGMPDVTLIYDGSNPLLEEQSSYLSCKVINVDMTVMRGCNAHLPQHMRYNTSLVQALFADLGMDDVDVDRALSSFTGVPGRFSVEHLSDQWVCIDDTYNANPGSFFMGLDALKQYAYDRLVLLIGDMKELGDQAEIWHERLAQKILELKPDCVYAIGDSCAMMKSFFREHDVFEGVCLTFDTVEDFLDSHVYQPQKGDLLYAKGSRSMRIDVAVRELKQGGM